MEKTREQKRPLLVTFIAVIFILNAISGISSITILLSPPITASNPEVFAAVETWSALERISPYILNVLLITSMVLLFFLKKSSLPLFAIYLGLELIIAVQRVL